MGCPNLTLRSEVYFLLILCDGVQENLLTLFLHETHAESSFNELHNQLLLPTLIIQWHHTNNTSSPGMWPPPLFSSTTMKHISTKIRQFLSDGTLQLVQWMWSANDCTHFWLSMHYVLCFISSICDLKRSVTASLQCQTLAEWSVQFLVDFIRRLWTWHCWYVMWFISQYSAKSAITANCWEWSQEECKFPQNDLILRTLRLPLTQPNSRRVIGLTLAWFYVSTADMPCWSPSKHCVGTTLSSVPLFSSFQTPCSWRASGNASVSKGCWLRIVFFVRKRPNLYRHRLKGCSNREPVFELWCIGFI